MGFVGRNPVSRKCDVEYSINKLIVGHPDSPSSLRKTGIVVWIRKNPGERIDFQDLWLTIRIAAHINPRPIAAPKNTIRFHAERFYFRLQ